MGNSCTKDVTPVFACSWFLFSGGCGRRKRDAQGDTRFFLGGNNCGNNYNSYPSNNYNSYPSNNYNNYPSNNYNNYPSNNYNQYPSNNHGSHYNTNQCSCTSLSFTDHYGNINGNCRSHDAGKGSWCYTTGWNSGCSDLQSSSRFPSNPWSYQACRYNGK